MKRFHLDSARHIFDEETPTFVSFKVKSYENLLIFYEANFFARKTRARLNQSSPNFPDVFVFTVPNAIEISFFQIHPKSGVMGQSGKVKGSMDSPYELEATERQECEERDNSTCLNQSKLLII